VKSFALLKTRWLGGVFKKSIVYKRNLGSLSGPVTLRVVAVDGWDFGATL